MGNIFLNFNIDSMPLTLIFLKSRGFVLSFNILHVQTFKKIF